MLSEEKTIILNKVYEANIHTEPKLSDICDVIRLQEYYEDMFIHKYSIRELWMMDKNRVASIKSSLEESLQSYDYNLMKGVTC